MGSTRATRGPWRRMHGEWLPNRVRRAVHHHVTTNRHHPEFHADPNDMTEVDLIEMVCDWTAMAQEFGQDGGVTEIDSGSVHQWCEAEIVGGVDGNTCLDEGGDDRRTIRNGCPVQEVDSVVIHEFCIRAGCDECSNNIRVTERHGLRKGGLRCVSTVCKQQLDVIEIASH